MLNDNAEEEHQGDFKLLLLLFSQKQKTTTLLQSEWLLRRLLFIDNVNIFFPVGYTETLIYKYGNTGEMVVFCLEPGQ